jgi:hypothetical protein
MKQRHILKASLLALALLAMAGKAKAEQFTLLIYETKADIAARTDKDKAPAYWAAYGGYAQALTAAGIPRGGTALPGNTGGKTVRASGQTDAPVAASDLELGGYFIIEVADLTTALEWARKSPGIATGAVEVKPHFVNPTMPAK